MSRKFTYPTAAPTVHGKKVICTLSPLGNMPTEDLDGAIRTMLKGEGGDGGTGTRVPFGVRACRA